jgi:hypothetical protein
LVVVNIAAEDFNTVESKSAFARALARSTSSFVARSNVADLEAECRGACGKKLRRRLGGDRYARELVGGAVNVRVDLTFYTALTPDPLRDRVLKELRDAIDGDLEQNVYDEAPEGSPLLASNVHEAASLDMIELIVAGVDTGVPSIAPTAPIPTVSPTPSPTPEPTPAPTARPSVTPGNPTAAPAKTAPPSFVPSLYPTVYPGNPTRSPVFRPTKKPVKNDNEDDTVGGGLDEGIGGLETGVDEVESAYTGLNIFLGILTLVGIAAILVLGGRFLRRRYLRRREARDKAGKDAADDLFDGDGGDDDDAVERIRASAGIAPEPALEPREEHKEETPKKPPPWDAFDAGDKFEKAEFAEVGVVDDIELQVCDGDSGSPLEREDSRRVSIRLITRSPTATPEAGRRELGFDEADV